MVINFSELPIPFHRLALGAVLIDGFGNRYMKMLTDDYEYFWCNQTDLILGSGLSDTQMGDTVKDDWKVLP